MVLADQVAAIAGSINFAAGSLDGRRELAIEVRDDEVVDRLHNIARPPPRNPMRTFSQRSHDKE